MKILRLEICNLASLTAEDHHPHIIDFTAQPLAAAGLIAITGPTGAGKSTLLDAICLALFNRIPRLRSARSGQQGVIPDGEHRPLEFDDPRTVLTRGAGSGYCRLDVQNQAGQKYRFEWRVKRARMKAQGKLQEVERNIIDLTTGQVLAAKKTECDALVPKLIGLDFEQFTRAVLLAQSEFGAFLKASDVDRARLLECLTNTSIFGKTGQLAYQRAKDAKKNLDLLELNKDHHQPLSALERADIEQQLTTAQDQLQKVKNDILHLQDALRWFEEAGVQAQKIEQAQEEVAQAQNQLQTFLPFKEQLQQYRNAIEIKPIWLEVEQHNVLQSDLQPKITELTNELSQLETQLQLAAQLQVQLEPVVQQLFLFQKQFSIQAEELNNLEIQRAELRQTYDLVRQQLRDGTERSQQLDVQLQELKAQLVSLQQESIQIGLVQESANTNLLDAAQLKSVFEHEIQLLAQAICTRIHFTGDTIYLIPDAKEKVANWKQQITLLRAEERKFEERIAEVKTAQIEYQQVSHLQQEIAELKEQSELLLKKQQSVQQHIVDIEPKVTGAHETVLRLEQAFKQQALLTNQSVETLREQLLPNEPCMVCGSHTHPFVEEISRLELMVKNSHQSVLQDAQKEHSLLLTQQIELRQNLKHLFETHQKNQEKLAQLSVGYRVLFVKWRDRVKLIEGDINITDSDVIESIKVSALLDQLCLKQIESQKTIQQQQNQWITNIEELEQAIYRTERLEQIKKQLNSLQLQTEQKLSEVGQQQQKNEQNTLNLTEIKQRGLALSEMIQAPLLAFLTTLTQLRQQYLQHRPEAVLTLFAQDDIDKVNLKGCEQKIRQLLQEISDDQQQYQRSQQQYEKRLGHLQGQLQIMQQQLFASIKQQKLAQQQTDSWIKKNPPFTEALLEQVLKISYMQVSDWQQQQEYIDQQLIKVHAQLSQLLEQQEKHLQLKPTQELPIIQSQLTAANSYQEQMQQDWAGIVAKIQLDNERQKQHQNADEAVSRARVEADRWDKINKVIGDASGDRFRKMAQGYQLEVLLYYANQQLERLNPRYRLIRAKETLSLLVEDHDLAGELRTTYSLSGGESFLVSLALALGLASMTSGQIQIESLFIDEGFGSLDSESLQIVMDALEQLHHQGRKVVVISHVAEMHERIAVQVQVERTGLGQSRVVIRG